MPNKELALKHSARLSMYLLIVWGFYRIFFSIPDEAIEELLIKPLVWLIPVWYLLRKEKLGLKSLGFTTNNLLPSIYLALGLGSLFAVEGVVINYLKYEGINFNANIGELALFTSLGISFATALSEEIAFRGYLYNRIAYALDDEYKANIITSLLWGLIHLPIIIFWYELSFAPALGYFILTVIFGIGSAFIFSRTKNVVSSILLHVLWSWPIILFR